MPKIHKILTLEQLVAFCESNKFYSFNSNDSGYTLSVQVPGTLQFEEKVMQGKLFTKVKVCHTLLNRNGSFASEENMKKAMPSLKYSPLLGYIHQLDSGEYDFHGHDIEIIKDENGEEKFIYKESQIGSFTADEPYLEYDEDMDKTYVIATAVIPEEYTMAADIIRRKSGTKVSCELCINSMSYNAKEKYLELEDFYFQGVTCLGCEKNGTEIGEGMIGSRLDIQDFSTNNNSVCAHFNTEENKKLIEAIEKLNNTISDISMFNINNPNRKEDPYQMNKFEELLNKYGKTAEDITFKYEGLSDEDLELLFKQTFEEDDPEDNPKEDPKDNHEDHEDNTGEDPVHDDNACGTKKKKKKKCSVTKDDGSVYEFELSLNDIENALYSLVNDTYADADNTWYGVSVYETYVIMNDWCNGKNYKQIYKQEDNNFSLTGDRVEVFANWLTKEEEASLDELRSNYAVIESQLIDYQNKEESQKKENLFESDDYKQIFEEERFIELKNNHSDLSYSELLSQLDSLLLSYAKSGSLKFSQENISQNKPLYTKVPLQNGKTKKKNRYGSLFSK